MVCCNYSNIYSFKTFFHSFKKTCKNTNKILFKKKYLLYK